MKIAHLIGFIILFIWFAGYVVFFFSIKNEDDRGMIVCASYGSEWKYKAGSFDHCVNPNGDIKGVY